MRLNPPTADQLAAAARSAGRLAQEATAAGDVEAASVFAAVITWAEAEHIKEQEYEIAAENAWVRDAENHFED